jgi:hypothetical protein
MKNLKKAVIGLSLGLSILLTGCGNEERKTFYDNGKIKQIGFYDSKDQLQDTFKVYDNDGKLITDLVYKDGKIISGYQTVLENIKIYDFELNSIIKYSYKNAEVINVERDSKFDNEIEKILKNYPEYITKIKDATPEMQITAFKANPSVMKTITNQSIELQKFALQNDYRFITYIPEQTEELQLFYISLYSDSVINLKNPTEKVMLKAIELNPSSFSIFAKQNPSEKVKKMAIEKNPALISFIENPSEELQLIAVNGDYLSILRLKNPTEKVIETAVFKNVEAVRFIKNLTLELQEKMITKDKNNAFAIGKDRIDQNIALKLAQEDIKFVSLLQNPSQELLEKAVISDENFTKETLLSLGELPEDLQLAIINKDKMLFRFIKNPTDKVILEAVKAYNKNFQYVKKDRQFEEVQLLVAKDYFIKDMYNPSKNVRLELAKYGNFLKYFGNDATNEEILINLKDNWSGLKYVQNPTDEMIMLAINNNPAAIQFVNNQTPQMQKEAIKLGGGNMYKFIKNPTPEVKALMK